MENKPKIDINLLGDSNEEMLPALKHSFPLERVYVDFSRYARNFVPWHWHDAIEFFRVDSGTVINETPGKVQCFKKGSCGIINVSVLHTTRSRENDPGQEHIFQVDASLLSGMPGGYIDERYFRPYLNADAFEMLYFPEGDPIAVMIGEMMDRDREGEWGNELRLRERMSAIWMEAIKGLPCGETHLEGTYEILRTMIGHISSHLAEPIRIEDLAGAAFISERECFRLFKNYMRTTPGEFILKRRLQYACELLSGTKLSIAEIAARCGMGYAYFSTRFANMYNCTPLRWRRLNSETFSKNDDYGTDRHKNSI